LDPGTGGGEVLARIVDGLMTRVVATEEWDVNAPVARRRLAPLGAHVLLAPNGRVVTQQCGPDDWAELWQFFACEHDCGDHFEAYTSEFRTTGLSVSGVRHYCKVAFRSLGDLVYMILVTPGLIPKFDPARDIDMLLELEDGCRTGDGIVLTESRYLIQADASTSE
jgi:hypothetical protein